MHAFAQTNLQLINQLQNSGYPPAKLKFVATAYELAMRLFTGRFRASGKTFIAHRSLGERKGLKNEPTRF